MAYLPEIGTIIFFIIIIYCWNRWVVRNFIPLVLKMNKYTTSSRYHQWLAEHEPRITHTLQLFYWLAGGVTIVMLLWLE